MVLFPCCLWKTNNLKKHKKRWTWHPKGNMYPQLWRQHLLGVKQRTRRGITLRRQDSFKNPWPDRKMTSMLYAHYCRGTEARKTIVTGAGIRTISQSKRVKSWLSKDRQDYQSNEWRMERWYKFTAGQLMETNVKVSLDKTLELQGLRWWQPSLTYKALYKGKCDIALNHGWLVGFLTWYTNG